MDQKHFPMLQQLYDNKENSFFEWSQVIRQKSSQTTAKRNEPPWSSSEQEQTEKENSISFSYHSRVDGLSELADVYFHYTSNFSSVETLVLDNILFVIDKETVTGLEKLINLETIIIGQAVFMTKNCNYNYNYNFESKQQNNYNKKYLKFPENSNNVGVEIGYRDIRNICKDWKKLKKCVLWIDNYNVMKNKKSKSSGCKYFVAFTNQMLSHCCETLESAEIFLIELKKIRDCLSMCVKINDLAIDLSLDTENIQYLAQNGYELFDKLGKMCSLEHVVLEFDQQWDIEIDPSKNWKLKAAKTKEEKIDALMVKVSKQLKAPTKASRYNNGKHFKLIKQMIENVQNLLIFIGYNNNKGEWKKFENNSIYLSQDQENTKCDNDNYAYNYGKLSLGGLWDKAIHRMIDDDKWWPKVQNNSSNYNNNIHNNRIENDNKDKINIKNKDKNQSKYKNCSNAKLNQLNINYFGSNIMHEWSNLNGICDNFNVTPLTIPGTVQPLMEHFGLFLLCHNCVMYESHDEYSSSDIDSGLGVIEPIQPKNMNILKTNVWEYIKSKAVRMNENDHESTRKSKDKVRHKQLKTKEELKKTKNTEVLKQLSLLVKEEFHDMLAAPLENEYYIAFKNDRDKATEELNDLQLDTDTLKKILMIVFKLCLFSSMPLSDPTILALSIQDIKSAQEMEKNMHKAQNIIDVATKQYDEKMNSKQSKFGGKLLSIPSYFYNNSLIFFFVNICNYLSKQDILFTLNGINVALHQMAFDLYLNGKTFLDNNVQIIDSDREADQDTFSSCLKSMNNLIDIETGTRYNLSVQRLEFRHDDNENKIGFTNGTYKMQISGGQQYFSQIKSLSLHTLFIDRLAFFSIVYVAKDYVFIHS